MKKAIFYFCLPACMAFLFCPKSIYAEQVELVISEIMYDLNGSDSGREWIEVYNASSEGVIVSSTWKFFDGSNHNLSLHQGSSTIAGGEHFILADNADNFLAEHPACQANIFDTVMSLGNSSSSVALSFDNGLTYPVIENYNSAWGASGNGYSLEKIHMNQNSDPENWQESFVLGGTPGLENSSSTPEEEPPEEERHWQQLLISEFLPNPEGSDSGEWIELQNFGPEILDIEGFVLQDNSSRRFVIDQDAGLNLVLAPEAYIVFSKEISGISLNNSTGDAVKLYDPDDNLQEIVDYEAAIEGRSYARNGNYFDWTKTPTPGLANRFTYNQAPIAQIVVESGDLLVAEKIEFSAKNSSDPEDEDLDYSWDFGDGDSSSKEKIKHSYKNMGSYTVLLEVTDSEGASDQASLDIIISQAIDGHEEENKEEKIESKILPIDFSEDDLFISEFIPNPKGSDDNEWIELYNNSSKLIDLLAWHLDDAEGGSKPYVFSSSTPIGSKEFLLVERSLSKITLNNSSDSVRLLTPGEKIWQEVIYEKIPEGQSQAWDMENSEWFVGEPSPGQVNLFFKEPEIVYSVAEAKDFAKGDQLLVQGVALRDVGSKDKRFYLLGYDYQDLDFEAVIEIYSYHKNFPEIKAGEVVTINGSISKTGDMPRLKIKAGEDIWKNDFQIELNKPEIMEVEDLDEDSLGSWASVRGTVVKKSGKNIYLAPAEDEDHLLRVYSNFSTKELEIKKGLELIAVGILVDTDSGFKLLPQSQKDILVSKAVLGDKEIARGEIGDDISTSSHSVVAEDRRGQAKNILWYVVGGVVILGIVYFIKNKSPRK
jgi:PKD repeat protein